MESFLRDNSYYSLHSSSPHSSEDKCKVGYSPRPRISFVIPAYNEEAYLGVCLDSILAEIEKGTHSTEVIVVNNASTDGTYAVAQSFAHRGIRVVDEPRKGLARARQAGFLASSGEFIAHVDADTLLPQGWVEEALKQFEKDRKLVALSSGPLVYYDFKKLTNFVVRVYYFFAYALYVINRFVLRTGSLLQGGNAIIRRSALEKINGYNTAYDFYGEDTDLARRLHAVGKVKFTLQFPTFTSGRRLATEGVVTMGSRYAINYFSTFFLKRPFTKTFLDISRTAQK